MINQKKNKKLKMSYWLLKLLPRNIKTNNKINQEIIIKNNSKIKAIGNIIPTMDHYSRNG